MVIDGKVDALFADHLVCSVAVWRHPDAGLSTLATPFTVEPFGIAVPPDAPLLLNLVQNYLATLDHTGLLATYQAKWLARRRAGSRRCPRPPCRALTLRSSWLCSGALAVAFGCASSPKTKPGPRRSAPC